MKNLKIPLLLLLMLTAASCIRNDVFPEAPVAEETLSEQREISINLICSDIAKTWRISQAKLVHNNFEIDITENYNVKDDEFIFSREFGETSLLWKRRYGINRQATTYEETLSQKYAHPVPSGFSFQEDSASEVVANSLDLRFTINSDETITASFGNSTSGLFNFTLVEKTEGDYITPPSSLSFSNAFSFETDLIGAPGMLGSYADNSLLITLREDRLAITPGQSPERIIKINLDDATVSDFIYHQPGFASRQCIIIDNEVIVVGGTRVNVYDRLNLVNEPMSHDFPIGTAYSRFGTAVQENNIFLIGGALGNDLEAENNRKKILKFDLTTKLLEDFTTLPIPKSGARSAIVDDHLYVFGGSETLFGSTPTKTIYKVNLSDASVTETLEMNTDIDFTFVDQDAHLIYVAGSKLQRDSSGAIIGRTATIGVLNTETNLYEEIPTDLTNASGFETIHQMCIINNKMYIIYGDEDTDTATATDFDIWNILVADLD